MQWHLGMAPTAQTPLGRGFHSSLGYFHSHNDYFNEQVAEGCANKSYVDMWDTDRPARTLNGTGPDGGYEEAVFTERALAIISHHPLTSPLYMYYALHTSCVGVKRPGDKYGVPGKAEALQAPARFYDQLGFIDNHNRRQNHAMIMLMDESVGRIADALQQRGMWADTLLVWSSDNGGAVHLGGGANSFPLRGGYYNNCKNDAAGIWVAFFQEFQRYRCGQGRAALACPRW